MILWVEGDRREVGKAGRRWSGGVGGRVAVLLLYDAKDGI